MRFSLGKVPTFGDFSQDFIRGSVRQDFIRVRCKIFKLTGELEKTFKTTPNLGTLPREKFATFSHRTLKVFL